MTPDSDLLRHYAENRDEAAFAEVVRRHVNLVYATALRSLNGDLHLAQDVSQTVFTDLARHLAAVRGRATVAGWLHTSARFHASKTVRTERRRRAREQESTAMTDPNPAAEVSWEQLRPLLDEAVGQLADADRDALLLRFFEDKSFNDVGSVLGLTENTARMRVERALDKLRAQFSRRGVTTTAALLASALGAEAAATTPAPAGLATSIVSHSLAGAASQGAAPALFPKISGPIWVGAGALAVAVLFLIFQPSPENNQPPAAQTSSTSSNNMKASQIISRGSLAAALLATAPAATGQNTAPSAPPSPAPAVADAATLATLVAANNRFAIDLFRRFNPKPNENAFFSPYSISTALAMTGAGAKGDTAAQIAKVFHFSDLPDNMVLAGFSALQDAIAKAQTLSGAKLAIANSLWPEQNPEHPLLQNYLDLVQANFSSAITPVDFIQHSADAAKQINDWVEGKTSGKIKDVLHPDDVDSLTRLVLVNAIYFKGAWMHPFSSWSNSNAEFHAVDGSAIPTVLMHQGMRTKYADITSGPAPCQILSLAYSNDSTGRIPQGVSFVAILPHAGTDLSALVNSLTAEQLAGWLGKLAETQVNVYLPKFKLEERYPLAGTLQAMGVKDAFNSKLADFSGMNGARDLYISKVIHQTFIDLDEKGTEAAAATAVELMIGGIGPPQPVPPEFRADHPFLFLIRDDVSGSILFLGQLASPAPLTEQIPDSKTGNGTLSFRSL